jgi:hypothetical protein
MPFRPDPSLSTNTYAQQPRLTDEYFYGGQTPMFRPDPALDTQTQSKRLMGTLGRFGYSMIEPIVEYGKGGIEAGYQGARHVGGMLNPTYRSAVAKSKTGQEMTQAESQAILGSGPEWLFESSERDFRQIEPDDWQKTALNMGKRTAGTMAYVAPAAVGFGAGGQLAYRGGMPVMQALASGASSGIGASVGQHVGLGVARGAIGGALSGFGASEAGEEVGSTLKGAAISGAIGGLLGYRGGKMAEKTRKQIAEANRIMMEKELYPTSKFAGKVGGSFTKLRAKAARDLDMGQIQSELYDMGATQFNSLDDAAARMQVVTGRHGELGGNNGVLTRMVDSALDGTDEVIQVDDVASALGETLDTSIDLDDKAVNKAMQQILRATPEGKTAPTISRVLKNAGFDADDADDILQAIRQAGSDPEFSNTRILLSEAGFDEKQITRALGAVANYSPSQHMQPGYAKADEAMKLNRVLEAKAREYWSAFARTQSERDKTLATAYTQASNVLDDRLNNVAGNQERMLSFWQSNPAYKQALNQAFPGTEWVPPLGEQVDDYVARSGASVQGIRNFQRPAVQMLKAIYETEKAPQLLEQSAQGLATRMGAAGLGLGMGSPIAAIIGYTTAPMIAPALGAIQNRATVPLSTRAGTIINALSNQGWKAYGLRGMAGMREGVRGMVESPLLYAPMMGIVNELGEEPPTTTKPLFAPRQKTYTVPPPLEYQMKYGNVPPAQAQGYQGYGRGY